MITRSASVRHDRSETEATAEPEARAGESSASARIEQEGRVESKVVTRADDQEVMIEQRKLIQQFSEQQTVTNARLDRSERERSEQERVSSITNRTSH